MSGNTFGKLFTVTSAGRKSRPSSGCHLDESSPGLPLCAEVQSDLDGASLVPVGTPHNAKSRSSGDSFWCI